MEMDKWNQDVCTVTALGSPENAAVSPTEWTVQNHILSISKI